MTITKTAPRAIFWNERAMCLWMQNHERHLMALSRAELHQAWEAAALGMKTEGHRAKKAELASDIARNDGTMLGEAWWDDRYMQEQIDTAEQRVRRVGTPTLWAGVEVSADGPCPASSCNLEHGWKVSDPRCIFCGADMA